MVFRHTCNTTTGANDTFFNTDTYGIMPHYNN